MHQPSNDSPNESIDPVVGSQIGTKNRISLWTDGKDNRSWRNRSGKDESAGNRDQQWRRHSCNLLETQGDSSPGIPKMFSTPLITLVARDNVASTLLAVWRRQQKGKNRKCFEDLRNEETTRVIERCSRIEPYIC